jgi:hypothetical protein
MTRNMGSLTVVLAVTLVAAVTALAGCGGGGDGSDGADGGFGFETDPAETTAVTERAEPASLDPAVLPPPGQARAEVDGQVFTLEAAGSVHFACEVTDDEIRINFQETESGSLSIQASPVTGEWNGTLTFAEGGANYGASLSGLEGLATGPDGVVYSGTLTYRTYSDPSDTRDVEGTIAVNCGTAAEGGLATATAEIAGETFSFPASGAQSFECEVTPTAMEVRVNRLALEDSQIEIQGSQQSGDWVGNVYVISGSDRYNAIFPADGTGLDITGTTVTFTGMFAQTSESDPGLEQEVSGSASVTCP